MKFVWFITEDSWQRRLEADVPCGSCRTGDICFDFITREYDGVLCLTFDCYVGGIDSGYGYGKDKYPYDYVGGADWDSPLDDMALDGFKKIAEVKMEKYINEDKILVEKANQPLHIW